MPDWFWQSLPLDHEDAGKVTSFRLRRSVDNNLTDCKVGMELVIHVVML